MPAIPPSPAESPELWDTLSLGAHVFPPRYPGAGAVKVTCDGGAEIDRPKANGKDGAIAKFKGKKVADISFVVTFPRGAWSEGLAFFMSIDPQASGYGLVWETTHPGITMRGANKVILESMTGIVTTGDMHSFSAKGSGWSAPDKPKGGTRTPKTAEKWTHSNVVTGEIPAGLNWDASPPPGGAGGDFLSEVDPNASYYDAVDTQGIQGALDGPAGPKAGP